MVKGEVFLGGFGDKGTKCGFCLGYVLGREYGQGKARERR